eukprot:TRINITY_DN76828_c0_g1_i1.p1 TRINITY_DN76828_c0_g1~~TRINITY_DN76828_c0_g1_i1.p1  ORF type:complete len:155 (+),score=19.53 TRINITY_DN76828_c0_g1_i1:28-465(+)
MSPALVILAASLLTSALSKPVDLTNHTLVDHLAKGKHLFVLFSNAEFDDTTGAHGDEKDAWEKLGVKYKDDEKVLVGHLHCYASVTEVKMCKEHKIVGYPTLAHYKGDEWTKPGRHQQYGGKRDFHSLVRFVEGYMREPYKADEL